MMNSLQQWQQWRQNRSNNWEQLTNRFLFPQQTMNNAEANDPLGPLPEGWGETASQIILKIIAVNN